MTHGIIQYHLPFWVTQPTARADIRPIKGLSGPRLVYGAIALPTSMPTTDAIGPAIGPNSRPTRGCRASCSGQPPPVPPITTDAGMNANTATIAAIMAVYATGVPAIETPPIPLTSRFSPLGVTVAMEHLL